MTDKVERGVQAQYLLENALLKEIVNELDEHYHAAWHEAKTVEAREDCHRYVTLLKRLTTDIQSIALTGKLEAARLRELEGTKRNIWQTLTDN